MKNAVKKLRSCAGETLVEVLASVLIVGLSALLLVSAFNAAAAINFAVRENDKSFRAYLAAAETGIDAKETAGTVTIKTYASPVTADALLSETPPAPSETETADVILSTHKDAGDGALCSYAKGGGTE